MTEQPKKTVEDLTIPAEFNKIINDFILDIVTTFPEYSGLIKRWWTRTTVSLEDETNPRAKAEVAFVFRHCVKVLPERFFDILYKNADIFNDDSTINTEFLPGIVFKQLWKCDISDNTRETVWKYLQLILFSVIGSVHNSAELGDAAKLFEAINEDELKDKLSETMENMQSMFDNFTKKNVDGEGDKESNAEDQGEGDSTSKEGMPNVDDIHKHINSMMEGKLGKLAMELAEETAAELDLDIDESKDAKDVFQKLFKNPGKLMSMVKNIGGKIETKIKSGEIKESELMSEGMDLLNQMKNMPGMGDMSKMFSQMGIPGLGKNTKVNMGAMESQLNKNMKAAKMRERMKAKAASNMNQAAASSSPANVEPAKPALSEEEIIKIFSTGEKVDRTPRGAKPSPNSTNNTNSNSNTNATNTNNKKKKSKK
jgi:hypothetical protein